MGTIDKPTKGSLDICGVHVSNKTGDRVLADLRLHHIGFVFQTFNLLPALTAVENVEVCSSTMFSLVKYLFFFFFSFFFFKFLSFSYQWFWLLIFRKKSADRELNSSLKLLVFPIVLIMFLLNFLEENSRYFFFFFFFFFQISFFFTQRVAIARAMANKPDILLLDEPTGDLDTVNSALIMELLVSLNKQQGVTLIMVTHDVGIKFFSDRVIWLRDGKIQRIELVSAEKRQESVDKLNAQLHEVQQRKEKQKSLNENRFVDQQQQDEGQKKKSKFIVRKPTDYKTHHDYAEGSAVALTDFTSVV